MTVRFVIQVLCCGEWQIEGKYSDRYMVSSVYNAMIEKPRRMLEIGAYGGAILRDSHEDGKAADYAADNQRTEHA